MWFQHAIGKEKILFMFDNEFDISSLEIDSVSFERFSDLKINFFSSNLPQKHPKKWDDDNFNALKLSITFGDMFQLKLSGPRIGFFCSPIIVTSEDYSEIKISNDDFHLHCKSKFLTINDIRPYVDERW